VHPCNELIDMALAEHKYASLQVASMQVTKPKTCRLAASQTCRLTFAVAHTNSFIAPASEN
jgi:hypothetical protein